MYMQNSMILCISLGRESIALTNSQKGPRPPLRLRTSFVKEQDLNNSIHPVLPSCQIEWIYLMSLLRPAVWLDLQSVFPFCNRCDCSAFGLYRCLSSCLLHNYLAFITWLLSCIISHLCPLKSQLKKWTFHMNVEMEMHICIEEPSINSAIGRPCWVGWNSQLLWC